MILYRLFYKKCVSTLYGLTPVQNALYFFFFLNAFREKTFFEARNDARFVNALLEFPSFLNWFPSKKCFRWRKESKSARFFSDSTKHNYFSKWFQFIEIETFILYFFFLSLIGGAHIYINAGEV